MPSARNAAERSSSTTCDADPVVARERERERRRPRARRDHRVGARRRAPTRRRAPPRTRSLTSRSRHRASPLAPECACRAARRARSRLHPDRGVVARPSPRSLARVVRRASRSTFRAATTFAATARAIGDARRPRRSTSATRWAAACACGSRSTGPTSCAALVLVSASPGIADADERAARVAADEALAAERRARRRRRVPRAAGSRNRCSRRVPPDAPGLADRRAAHARVPRGTACACSAPARWNRCGTDSPELQMPVAARDRHARREVRRRSRAACSNACSARRRARAARRRSRAAARATRRCSAASSPRSRAHGTASRPTARPRAARRARAGSATVPIERGDERRRIGAVSARAATGAIASGAASEREQRPRCAARRTPTTATSAPTMHPTYSSRRARARRCAPRACACPRRGRSSTSRTLLASRIPHAGQADRERAPPRRRRERARAARTRCRPSRRSRRTRAPSLRRGRCSRTASARRCT